MESADLLQLVKQQMEQQQQQMDILMKMLSDGSKGPSTSSTTTPSFSPFDPSSELWADYLARFNTFLGANSVSEYRQAQVFLTNQSPTIYKLLSNLASQQSSKDINELSMEDITAFMKDQFDPRRFVVRERFKFWSDMKRRPGETVQELAARIRQDAATCDFASISDPQDEALRTRFICSVNNEAILKALFKVKDDELDFARAIEIATETEEAAKVAKETVYGSHVGLPSVNKVHSFSGRQGQKSKNEKPRNQRNDIRCYRCGKANHLANECRFKSFTCNFCHKEGHLEAACRKKAAETRKTGHVKTIRRQMIKTVSQRAGSLHMENVTKVIMINGYQLEMELDTATTGNFLTEESWAELGKPNLTTPNHEYESASKHTMPVVGTFVAKTKTVDKEEHNVEFTVSRVPGLNLLGRIAIKMLRISVDEALAATPITQDGRPVKAVFDKLEPDKKLQEACKKLCDEFPDLWKDELGCLKDFELEMKFKPDAIPVFKKPRPVPIAVQEDLAAAYDAGIAKGVWIPVQFNDYGTPVVPVRKQQVPGQAKKKIRVCGDYSVTINSQLETHRQPLPLPEALMRRLGGGHGYTKIDLADAYNQIKLAPESQRKLALSTHRGVLLQTRLPFGITSAPGHFQEIMENLTKDLPGVAVYLDDILVSGANADDHLQNLRGLLQFVSMPKA